MSRPSPLPNFLGIGVPRAGTTWLHHLLDAHPDVLMPSRRKELRFFDRHYHRGLEWYARSYQLPADGVVPPRVGEISPLYVYQEECRPRIEELGSVDRFIVCLRDPVDLLWSTYRHQSAIHDFRGSFAEYVEANPDKVAYGFYARALRPWVEQFGAERFLFLRFDEMVTDLATTRHSVASFLGIDVGGFPAGAGEVQVNQAIRPRFRRTYSLAKRAVIRLHRADQTWLVDAAKRAGLRRVVALGAEQGPAPELPGDQHERLQSLYAPDLAELRDLCGLDIGSWMPQA